MKTKNYVPLFHLVFQQTLFEQHLAIRILGQSKSLALGYWQQVLALEMYSCVNLTPANGAQIRHNAPSLGIG